MRVVRPCEVMLLTDEPCDRVRFITGNSMLEKVTVTISNKSIVNLVRYS